MTQTLFCYNHPTRETTLRCNNCDRPICTACAVRTPTGYRCRECVRGQQKKFDTSEWYDYLFGFAMAGVLSLIASILAGLVNSFGFFMFLIIGFVASTVGVVIAEACRFVTRKHRSRRLFLTCIAGMILGAAPVIAVHLFTLDVFGLIAQAIYLIVATPVMYSRLSGLQLFRS